MYLDRVMKEALTVALPAASTVSLARSMTSDNPVPSIKLPWICSNTCKVVYLLGLSFLDAATATDSRQPIVRYAKSPTKDATQVVNAAKYQKRAKTHDVI